MATPAVDPLAALRAIQSALATRGVEEVPDGWLTVDQWAAEWGKSRCQAGVLLRAGEAAGVMECRKYCIATGNGRRGVQHYRPK